MSGWGGGGWREVEGAGHWKLQTSQPTLFGYTVEPLRHLYSRETKFGPGELITYFFGLATGRPLTKKIEGFKKVVVISVFVTSIRGKGTW